MPLPTLSPTSLSYCRPTLDATSYFFSFFIFWAKSIWTLYKFDSLIMFVILSSIVLFILCSWSPHDLLVLSLAILVSASPWTREKLDICLNLPTMCHYFTLIIVTQPKALIIEWSLERLLSTSTLWGHVTPDWPQLKWSAVFRTEAFRLFYGIVGTFYKNARKKCGKTCFTSTCVSIATSALI